MFHLMEDPTKIDDLGVALFWESPMYVSPLIEALWNGTTSFFMEWWGKGSYPSITGDVYIYT